jgi:hypothetical protein
MANQSNQGQGQGEVKHPESDKRLKENRDSSNRSSGGSGSQSSNRSSSGSGSSNS